LRAGHAPRSPWAGPGSLAVLLFAAAAQADQARIVLRWKEVPGASAYEVQIARDAGFTELVLQTRTIAPAYRWSELPSNTHWWRVRSVDAEGRPSEWSAARTVAVDSVVPEPVRPPDGAVLPCGAPVEVELAATVLAQVYILELSSSPAFSGARELRQAEPVFKLGALGPGTWHLRASAVDLRGRRAGPGPPWSLVVRLAAPRLKPAGDVFIGTPQVWLGWTQVACAASYLLEATSDARERVTMAAADPGLAVRPNVAGDYRFRVAGVDEAGTSGEWSAEAGFRVRLPAPVLKAEALSEVAELAWTPVPTATGYRLELGPEGGPVDPAGGVWTTGPGWRSGPLAPGRYAWRVQARDAAGHLSAFSEARAFALEPPRPLEPPELEVGEEVVPVDTELDLAWKQVPEASRYEVQLDEAPLPVVQSPGLRTPPLAEGWHRFRVRALLPPGRESPWSEPWEVYAGVPPVTDLALERDGDLVKVRLVDRRGRIVQAAAPRFEVPAGGLDPAELRDGWWVMRWRAPPSGEDLLLVDERSFHAERPLQLTALAPAWVALQAGAVVNGGAVASPSLALGAGVRLPLFQRRVAVELRASLALASASLVVGGSTWRASAVLVPVSLLAQWQQPVGGFVVRGAIGPSLLVAGVTVNDAQEGRVLPGLELAVSASTSLGRGRVELEVAVTAARLDTELARLNAGGVSFRLGYALDLGVR
jgi:hypothetical protein